MNLNCMIGDIIYAPRIEVQYLHNVECPLHLHFNMEIVYSSSGTLTMQVNGETRIIKEGQITFVMPFESHSFQYASENDIVVLVFDPRLVEHFFRRVLNRSYSPKVFLADADVVACANKLLLDENLRDEIVCKAILYPLCAQLIQNCAFDKDAAGGSEILLHALTYMVQNYKGDITLTSTAKHIGVHPVYLSRYFSENAGFTFSVYLNMIRFSCAERMLRENKFGMSEIAYESGFGSLRNFNRVFLKLSGKTPTEYGRKVSFTVTESRLT